MWRGIKGEDYSYIGVIFVICQYVDMMEIGKGYFYICLF